MRLSGSRGRQSVCPARFATQFGFPDRGARKALRNGLGMQVLQRHRRQVVIDAVDRDRTGVKAGQGSHGLLYT